MHSRPGIRLGILVDNESVFEWEQQIIDQVLAKNLASFIAVIFIGEPPTLARSWLDRLRNLPLRLVRKLEARKLRRSPLHWGSLQRCQLRLVPDAKLHIAPLWSSSGNSWELRNSESGVIRDLKLDVVLRFCSGILRGEILSIPRHGVLSLHHGDNRKYRGLPPGFWEVYHREGTSGYILQTLTKELDGGNVVARGVVSTQTYFLRNQAHLFMHSTSKVLSVLQTLHDVGSLPAAEKSSPYSDRLYQEPDFFTVLRYLTQQLTRLARSFVTRKLSDGDRWSVAIMDQSWVNSVLWKSSELQPAKGTWMADPFLIEHRGRSFCFVEEFVEEKRRGRIAVYEITGRAHKRLGVAIEEPFHLSFPFVFHYSGSLYMIPESSENEDIRLYRCGGNSLEWTLDRIIMSDLQAVDSMMFSHGSDWFMLTNEDPTKSMDFASNLSVFRSDSPLSSQWVRLNPAAVQIDHACVRNGGLLRDGPEVYRVGQVADFGSYGSSFKVLRIHSIQGDHYAEEAVAHILPNFRSGLRGTHHMSSVGTTTAIDLNFHRRRKIWS